MLEMTLDEAIEHCKENAQKETQNGNLQCAMEHNQLAIWLSQLEESKSKAAAYDRLMSALTSILTKAKEVENLSPSNVDWWCPNCGTTSCTYDGRCTKCGAEIEQFQVEPFKDSLHELIDGLLSVFPDEFESDIPSKVKYGDIPSREDA